MLTSIVLKSHLGKRFGARDMTILCAIFEVLRSPDSPHPFAFVDFLRVYNPWEVSIFLVVKFYVEWSQNHVWGFFGARDISTFVKRFFCGGRFGR